MSRGRIPAAALLAALAAAAPPAMSATLGDPGCGEARLATREGGLLYRLPHGFIRAGSDTVTGATGRLVPGRDYALDRLRGELRLLRPPVAGETLVVRTCWLLRPPPLGLQLNSYRPPAAAAVDSAAPVAVSGRPAVAPVPGGLFEGTALRVNGNKTIAVDFGSAQDAFLRQSLDLAVSGRIAPGVEVTGVLSDRDVPLTESGTTQDLQSLDRILLEVRAPQGAAALGDVTLSLRRGDFARIDRRLQGVRGEATVGGFTTTVAAASAQGEYHRLQFYGADGRQGPYALTDRSGNPGVSVVPASEAVYVDGERMQRGESADYGIDYDRGQITFSNRRPISAASRITVDYQYSLEKYRRNLAAVDGQWEKGGRWMFTRFITEGDDRGRPLGTPLGEEDRVALADAGDSSSVALGAGVTPGVGDYDTVRVAGRVVFAFVGRDSGGFAVRFARVAPGEGDYADSAVVGGVVAYRYAGAGGGAYRIGRALPLPRSQQLWALGGGGALGPLRIEAEGAVSRMDLNTASALDDGDNAGLAGRVSLGLEGRLARLPARAGVQIVARDVDPRFAPFDRLSYPFAQEDWALPPGADLDQCRQLGASAWLRPSAGGELRAGVASLQTPWGYAATRREAQWANEGRFSSRAVFQHVRGDDPALRAGQSGRDLLSAEARLRGRWIEPGLRAVSDARRYPSNDTAAAGGRYREVGADLRSGSAVPWKLLGTVILRRDAVAVGDGFAERSQTWTTRGGVESPAQSRIGLALFAEHRDISPVGEGARGQTDLASLRLRGDDRERGLGGALTVEVTSTGSPARTRSLSYVGPGLGKYDANGNFVGTGDYDLVLRLEASLERLTGSALSLDATWQVQGGEALRGSRLQLTADNQAQRRGPFEMGDVILTPRGAVSDSGLARGRVRLRLEGDLAPTSRVAAFRLRLESRTEADRSYLNYAQSMQDRLGSLRWTTRPGRALSTELEGRVQRQEARQEFTGGTPYSRALIEQALAGQLIWTPAPALRGALHLDLLWTRPEGTAEPTRTVRIGPDLGFNVGPRGRAEFNLRRSLSSGPPALALLPSPDPAGHPIWEGTGRLDYRVIKIITVGLTTGWRRFEGRPANVLGRAEVRAFF